VRYAQQLSVQTNWATNIEFHDSQTLHPTNVEELASIITSHDKVRVRGSGHCFNTIADSHNCVILLDQLKYENKIDEENLTAHVGAGMNYAQIAEFLQPRGFAIHNLASLPHISLAGAISTGTHGSGINNGALHTALHSITLMNSSGEIKKYTQGVDSEFEATVVGLGLTGVFISCELKIQPTFNIYQTVYGEMSRQLFQDNVRDILSGAYSVSFFTTWSDDQLGDLWFKSLAPTPDQYFGVAARAEKSHPIFGEDPSSTTEQLGVAGPWHLRLPHFRIDAKPSAGNELQSEFFVDSQLASQAFAAIEEIAPQFRHQLLVTEIRAIAADSHWLSPAYSRESVAFHCTWRNDPEVPSLVALMEAALQPFEARAHMGKIFTLTPAQLRSVTPRFDDFASRLAEIDPMNKWGNEFTDNLFH
jgi:xylitol oxidase